MNHNFELNNLDNKNLRGERVFLRSLIVEDAKEIYEAIQCSLDKLREFPATMIWALEEPSIENSINFCRFMKEQFERNKEIVFTIRINNSNKLIGLIGLHNIKWNIPRGEIGIWGNSCYSKNGYMTEAMKILINFLKNDLKFNRIEAFVDQENINAIKICKNSKFELEGIMKNALKNPLNNSLRNLCIYSITEV
ncbi:GNAT family N-acetyltransferase [Acinetobacter sp. UBA6720]|uniref:GNAT family N-acetyltransferase n=1 Tax=Acinetobacter sp. UBA6720 TaxID=1945953 RepID=UPI0025C10AC9|nr:GNAT family N-acetyltransferase [Acinetobacter sp. UBA6720]